MRTKCQRTNTRRWPYTRPVPGMILRVITSNDTEYIREVRVGDMTSDQALVRFTLLASKIDISSTQWITSRAWRRLPHDAFASDVPAYSLYTDLYRRSTVCLSTECR